MSNEFLLTYSDDEFNTSKFIWFGTEKELLSFVEDGGDKFVIIDALEVKIIKDII